MPNEIQIQEIECLIYFYYSCKLLPCTKRHFKRLIHRFGFSEVFECLEIAVNQYDNPKEVVDKIGGICYNRQQEKRG